jgi:hypothetical protein
MFSVLLTRESSTSEVLQATLMFVVCYFHLLIASYLLWDSLAIANSVVNYLHHFGIYYLSLQ